MAQTDPVYITFEFRGDIDKEVNKVTLGIKGLRDEAATTYNKLIADSSAAYNAMSAESRKLATTMQENISSLRSLSAMQEQLDRELEAGTITLSGYTQAKAALALQESNLRVVISQGMAAAATADGHRTGGVRQRDRPDTQVAATDRGLFPAFQNGP